MKKLIFLLFFLVAWNTYGQGWKLDSAISTAMDLPLDPVANFISNPIQVNDKQFIVQINNRTDGHCLYVSDGTQKGTEMIKRFRKIIREGYFGGLSFTNPFIGIPTRFQNKIYFFVNLGQQYDNLRCELVAYNEYQWWESDGTKEGTKVVDGLENTFKSDGLRTVGKNLYYFDNSKTYILKDNKFQTAFLNDFTNNQTYNISELYEIKKLSENGKNVLFEAFVKSPNLDFTKRRPVLIKYDTETQKSRILLLDSNGTFYYKTFPYKDDFMVIGMNKENSFVYKISDSFSKIEKVFTYNNSNNYFDLYQSNANYLIDDKFIYVTFIQENLYKAYKLELATKKSNLIYSSKFTAENLSNYIEKQEKNILLVSPAIINSAVDTLTKGLIPRFKFISYDPENNLVTEIGKDWFKNYPSTPRTMHVNLFNFNKLTSGEIEFSLYNNVDVKYYTLNESTLSEPYIKSKAFLESNNFSFNGENLSCNVLPNQISSYDQNSKKLTPKIDFGFNGKRLSTVLYQDEKRTFLLNVNELYDVVNRISLTGSIGVSQRSIGVTINGKFKYLTRDYLYDYFKFGNKLYFVDGGNMLKYNLVNDQIENIRFGYSSSEPRPIQGNLIPFSSDAIIDGKGFGRKGNELGFIDEKDNFTTLAKIDSLERVEVIVKNNKVWFFIWDKTNTNRKIYIYENGTYLEIQTYPVFNNVEPGYQKIGDKQFFFSNYCPKFIYVKKGTDSTVLINIEKKSTNRSFSYNGKFYFTANENNLGEELWVSDGTVANTKMLVDIETGAESSYPIFLGVFGERLYFTAFTEKTGQELYSTDGTPEGTILEMDFQPGPRNSRPFFFNYKDKKLVVMAYNSTYGYQTWSKDVVLANEANTEERKTEITISPNPVADNLNYEFINGSAIKHDAIILNATGSIVYTKNNLNTLQNKLNTVTLSPGIYFLLIKTEHGSIGKKFVKL